MSRNLNRMNHTAAVIVETTGDMKAVDLLISAASEARHLVAILSWGT